MATKIKVTKIKPVKAPAGLRPAKRDILMATISKTLSKRNKLKAPKIEKAPKFKVPSIAKFKSK